MPVVHYTKPQQGYRPFMNPRPLAGLRGLRGMGLGQMLPSNLLTVKYADGTSGFFDPADGTYYDSQGNDVTGYVQNFGGAQIGGTATSQQISAAEGIPPAASGAPATPSPTVTAPLQAGPSTPAGVPTGSYLAYTGTWQLPGMTLNGQEVLSSVLQVLKGSAARSGLQVVGASQQSGLGNINLAGTFTVQIQLFVNGPGFAQPNDAGSFVDNAFYQVTKAMPANSSTVVTKFPAGASSTSVPTSEPGGIAGSINLTTWLEQNAIWLGLGVAAIVVLPKVIR